MDESVPNPSSNIAGGATNRRQRATTTTSPPASPSQTNRNSTYDTDDDRSRRRRFNGSLFLSPTFIISKFILVLSILLKILLFPLRKVGNIMFPLGEFDNVLHDPTSKKAANAFVQVFTKDYIQPIQARADMLGGDVNASLLECPFMTTGYTITVNELASQGQQHNADADANPPAPLLLIYLHSPLHGKVPEFLRKTLCNTRVLSLINQHRGNGTLTCWGGSIHTADGANAKDSLQVSCFPFLSLVRVQPISTSNRNNSQRSAVEERKLEVLFRMEGPALQTIRPGTLHTHLSNSLVKYQAILSEQAMRRIHRQQEVSLREEQDREYRETLEEDRRRERLKIEEQERKEEEKRKKVEEEERVVNEKLNRLENARAILARNGEGEPDAKDASIKIAKVRIMLPSGKKIQRRFLANDTIDTLRAFLILHFHDNEVGIENFQMSSNYPKKTLVDGDKTLEIEGLCPQAVIMVQDLDA